MKWCCSVFQGWYENGGQRGMAIAAKHTGQNTIKFFLQSRAIDGGVSKLPITDFPISVITQLGIDYCPWCGRELQRWYGKYSIQLATPHLISDFE